MYYFAYGSNMHWDQMKKRCPSTSFIAVAHLPDYQFGITRHSRLRNCGTANVFPASGSKVWGVVYDVSDKDLFVLDSFEDGYRREFLLVYAEGNGRQPERALVYLAEEEINVPLPNAEYKRLLVEGATHRQLPVSYLAMLNGIITAE